MRWMAIACCQKAQGFGPTLCRSDSVLQQPPLAKLHPSAAKLWRAHARANKISGSITMLLHIVLTPGSESPVWNVWE